VEYLGYGNDAINGPANGFQNGPAGCVVNADLGGTDTAAPGTPDTGFALVSNHPLTTLAVAAVSALAIFGVARSTRRATSRR
jgi:hypothetical protein